MRTVFVATVLAAALAAVSAAVSAAPVAGAVETVTVTLKIDVHGAVPYKECDVVVPAGADGDAVLAQAEADGCIDSYETTTYPFGTFVDCIDGICSVCPTLVTCGYWAMREDGQYTSYGVDGFRAADGKTLQFSYEALPLWVLGMVGLP